MAAGHQGELFVSEPPPSSEQVGNVIVGILSAHQQPSAWDLLNILEHELGWKARWAVKSAVNELLAAPTSKNAWHAYLASLMQSGDLDAALKGGDAPRNEISSSVDSLLRHSKIYHDSEAFREMVNFMARFRDYAPYNNLLVRIQNPTCGFYATERDWKHRFDRDLKVDARPMLILAPMHPVMLVYALDETEGPSLPQELNSFAHFRGEWNPEWLLRTVQNAALRDRILVNFKTLSSTNAGFATSRARGEWKMRIGIHDGLDGPSQYGVLCHELAHIYLGHLGTDRDHWWPARTELDGRAVEIEAEATAFIVTLRRRLRGSSPAYVSRYLGGGPLPLSVSLDHVAKVASRIEEMGDRRLQPREPGVGRTPGPQGTPDSDV